MAMNLKRIAGSAAVAAAVGGSLFAGATALASGAGADPWKCESCGFPFPVPNPPGDWNVGVPAGHLPPPGEVRGPYPPWIPPGHLPPPGEARVFTPPWLPPGHLPPPVPWAPPLP